MNLYTKVLTKMSVSNDLTVTVKVECEAEGGLSRADRAAGTDCA
jgi:hypothetical protein